MGNSNLSGAVEKLAKHLLENFKVKNMIIIEFRRLEYPAIFFYISDTEFVKRLKRDEKLVSDLFVLEKYAILVKLVTGEVLAFKEINISDDRYLLVFEVTENSEGEERAIHLIKKLNRKSKKEFNWSENIRLRKIITLVLNVHYTPRRRVNMDKSS